MSNSRVNKLFLLLSLTIAVTCVMVALTIVQDRMEKHWYTQAPPRLPRKKVIPARSYPHGCIQDEDGNIQILRQNKADQEYGNRYHYITKTGETRFHYIHSYDRLNMLNRKITCNKLKAYQRISLR